jgi:hypothetical protein
MNEILGLILLIVPVAAALAAFVVVMHMLFPARLAKTRAVLDARPGRAGVVGLINLLFFFAVAAGLFALGQNTGLQIIALLGVLVLLAVVVGLVFGLSAFIAKVGHTLKPGSGPVVQALWGAATVGLACLLPYVGWFGLLPVIAVLGLGSFILALTQKEPTPAAPAE